MRIFILTEGGGNIGFGHITRCLALYEALENKGVNSKLVVMGDKAVVSALEYAQYEIFDWIGDIKRLLRVIMPDDVVIIDSYLAPKSIYRRVSDAAQEIICFDDNKRIDYPGGVVVNGSVGALNMRYPKYPGGRNMVGPQYALLRKEFSSVPGKKIRKYIKNVMITFGGEDRRNLTPKVAALVKEIFPRATLMVAIGREFKNETQINKACGDRAEYIHAPDAKTMKSIMHRSDIAFSAGGQTLNELARVGVPTVAVAVADNQMRNISGWKERGFIEYAGRWNDKSLMRRIAVAARVLEGGRARASHSDAGRSSIDGKGPSRIAASILENNINLRPAAKSDAKDIWLWRNSPQAIRNSFNSKPVFWQEHKRWLETKIKDHRTRIYIAERGADKIGVIRFDMDNGSATVSVNLNPGFIGMGLGKRIIKIGSRMALKDLAPRYITAEIKDDNRASFKAFVDAGYKFSGRNERACLYILGDRCNA